MEINWTLRGLFERRSEAISRAVREKYNCSIEDLITKDETGNLCKQVLCAFDDIIEMFNLSKPGLNKHLHNIVEEKDDVMRSFIVDNVEWFLKEKDDLNAYLNAKEINEKEDIKWT